MDREQSAGIGSVAIVGLGLIGGSMARDLAARGIRVFAWDRDNAALRAAMEQGIAQPVLWNEPLDAIVIALPVRAALEMLPRIALKMDGVRLIVDAGSTKRSIVHAAQALGIGERFVGSHPLAGDHGSGWNASRAGLFTGARVFLCPTPSTGGEAMALAKEMWTMLGARPEETDAEEHDRRLAWTSHLPHLLSFALGGALAGEGIAHGELGPGGRDVARLAGSSPEMWADIAADNADALVPALQAAEEKLRAIRHMVASGYHAQLRDVLADVRDWHGQWMGHD
jgi:prephenate dehydrogenase